MPKSFPQRVPTKPVGFGHSQITLLGGVCYSNHYALIIFVLRQTKFRTNLSFFKKYGNFEREESAKQSGHKSQKKQFIFCLSSLSCLYVQLRPDFNCSCCSSSAFPSALIFVKVSSGEDRSTAIPSICRSSLHSVCQESHRQ